MSLEPSGRPEETGSVSGEKEITRKDFLIGAGIAAAAVAAGAAGIVSARNRKAPQDATGEASIREIPQAPSIPKDNFDPLTRMQDDLRRAMAKPVEQRRWMMVIDTRKCVGCSACTVACIAENKLPPGVVYRPVVTEEIGVFPHVNLRFTPRPCMHCDQPACVPVCPVFATWKRPDGIVAVDYDACIGCGYCVTACPYNARCRDLGENYTDATPQLQPYEEKPSHEYGKKWDRSRHGSPSGNARKCHFCVHRLEHGMLPECVATCIGRATAFGDASDPESLVSELSARPNGVRLLEERATLPRVLYLI